MIDETMNPAGEGSASTPGGSGDPVVAYCQQCGRALTSASQRRVGTSTLCEPCAAVRLAQPAGWTPVNAGGAPSFPGGAANAGASGEPNPALAGFLGMIPGVGAMYNGQYAKGVIHLIIFVVLVSLADNLNWVFWWFVWGWVFYQAFEAYHTALARRDGQPLPDPFGWNEVGERLGVDRNWPHFAPGSPPRRPAAPVPAPPVSPAGTGYASTSAPTAAGVADPLSAYAAYSASAGTPSASIPRASAMPPTGAVPFTDVPYASTYTGGVSPSIAQSGFALGSRRFPAGAAWLIGLGVLFLIGNILPEWRIGGRWLVPILLAAVALWTGGRRLSAMHGARLSPTPAPSGKPLPRDVPRALLGPILLLTIAILLVFQDAYIVPLRHSWPALLIVWGGLLLLGQLPQSSGEFSSQEDASVPAQPAAEVRRP